MSCSYPGASADQSREWKEKGVSLQHFCAHHLQVDRSNREREAIANEQLMTGIRSKAAGYESLGSKTTGRLK